MEREEFLLELDPHRASGSGGTDIDRRSRGKIRMAEFHRELGDSLRPAAFVMRAQADDEMVFVERKVLGIEEENLAHVVFKRVVRLLDMHIKFLRRMPDDFPEVHEGRRGLEVIRLKDDLILAVLDRILRGVENFVRGHVAM